MLPSPILFPWGNHPKEETEEDHAGGSDWAVPFPLQDSTPASCPSARIPWAGCSTSWTWIMTSCLTTLKSMPSIWTSMNPVSSPCSTPATPSRMASSQTMSGATASRSLEVRWGAEPWVVIQAHILGTLAGTSPWNNILPRVGDPS